MRSAAAAARSRASSRVSPFAEHRARPVGADAQRAEAPARRAVDAHADDAVHAGRLLDALDRRERARRRDEEARRTAPPTGSSGVEHLSRDLLAERAGEREPVQVDAERGLAELRVVPAAEPRSELDHLRALRADDDLRVRRAVLDPERCGRLARRLDRGADVRRRERTRPDVRERDAERRRLGA